MKLRPRAPGDQNATMLHALVAGEIAIRRAHPNAAPGRRASHEEVLSDETADEARGLGEA